MTDMYHAIADRLADGRCPSVLQFATDMDPEQAFETMALSDQAVSALVSPLSDTASPVNQMAGRVTQTETEIIGVTMALVSPGGFEQFVPARDEIKAGLAGWIPPGASGGLQYLGGQRLQYSLQRDGGRWLHLLRFRVSKQRTYEVQP